MRIGELAAQAGVHVETLRYYERRGLLRKPARLRSGFRSYPPEALRVVRFIKQAQGLGFSLEDIEQLLKLAAKEPANCQAVHSLATKKLEEIDQKLAALSSMRDAVLRLIETCDRPRAHRECPLLTTLLEEDA